MIILEASPDMLVCMPNFTQEWYGLCNALGIDSIDLSKVLVIFYRNTLTTDSSDAYLHSRQTTRGAIADPDQTDFFSRS